MLKFLLLSILFMVSPAFALCMDCNMIPPPNIFQTEFFFQIFTAATIVIHMAFICWCFKSWTKNKAIISKTVSSLFLILWTAFSIQAYMNIHDYIFYTFFTMAIFIIIYSDFLPYEAKPSKKAYIIMSVYLLLALALHTIGVFYADGLGIYLHEDPTNLYYIP